MAKFYSSDAPEYQVEPEKFDESKKVFLEGTELVPEEYHVYRIEEDKSIKRFDYEPVTL